MIADARTLVDRLREKKQAIGTSGIAREAANRALTKWASLDLVHVMLLERDCVRPQAADTCVEMRFLSPDDVRRFARRPVNGLSDTFARRLERGLDRCYAAIHGDRLASYGWYAFHSVEPEHSAGAALAFPADMAYLYKGFTHPDFRGRRLYGATMGAALRALGERGVTRLLAFVYWSNRAALNASDRLGYRNLGMLAVGPKGPVRVPPHARRYGVRFGAEAARDLECRMPPGSVLSTQA